MNLKNKNLFKRTYPKLYPALKTPVPKISIKIKRTRNIKNKILEICALKIAILGKPNTPAIKAITKNITATSNMIHLHVYLFFCI